eukprot:TRINITY_DN692_c7_g1_i1.p1 TRINITY_DN692_c7_g1~~TRINITY_DN692_c7_g1_i1.p1  ORF type:complete len:475 (-),score=69.16 TRINITY_DN692_c7_g1_i1:265-1593(-)
MAEAHQVLINADGDDTISPDTYRRRQPLLENEYLRKIGIPPRLWGRGGPNDASSHSLTTGVEPVVGFQSSNSLPDSKWIPQFDEYAAMWEQKSMNYTLLQSTATAATTIAIAMTPLEVARMRQIIPSATWPSYIPRPPVLSTSAVLKSILRHEGFAYLYRGSVPLVLSRIARQTCQQAAIGMVSKLSMMVPLGLIGKAWLGACIGALMALPIQTVLDMSRHRLYHPLAHRMWGCHWDVHTRCMQQEGLLLWWMRAAPMWFAKETVLFGMLFSSWHLSMELAGRWIIGETTDVRGEKIAKLGHLAGAVCGTVAAVVSHPFDFLYTRAILSTAVPPLSYMQHLRLVCRHDGWWGIWRGVGPRILFYGVLSSLWLGYYSHLAVMHSEMRLLNLDHLADGRTKELENHFLSLAVSPNERAVAIVDKLTHAPSIAVPMKKAVPGAAY